MADKRYSDNPRQPLQEEDVIARLKSAAGGELAGLTTYTGLLSRSSREGYWSLYPTLDMSTYIEIEESDVIHSEPLPPEQSPFGGLGGTLVFVRKGAQVTTTRTLSRSAQAGASDEFDLDLRVGQAKFGQSDVLRPKTEDGTICDTPFCPSWNCPKAQAAVETQAWTCRPTQCLDTCRCTRGCPRPTLGFTCIRTDCLCD